MKNSLISKRGKHFSVKIGVYFTSETENIRFLRKRGYSPASKIVIITQKRNFLPILFHSSFQFPTPIYF